MRTGKWATMVSFTLGLLLTGGLAFGKEVLRPVELLNKIQVGVTTSQQVTELLGAPAGIAKYPRRAVEAWQYWVLDYGSKVEISIEIDSKGVVQSVQRIRHFGP